MEIRLIETFLKVASLQNFSKAAEQLGYSQSAVTVQIQNLEKELGVSLFERIGKRIYLTEKGKEFIPYAGEITSACKKALDFGKNEEDAGGFLKIGGVESVCTALMPKLLFKFYEKCPNVQVVIKAGTTDEMLSLASDNQLDMVLTLDEKLYKPDFVCPLIKEEPVIFVSLCKDKALKGRTVPVSELSKKPFILTEKGAAYRLELERLLAKKDMGIDPILETGNTETIINLLKKGMGISFLPKFTVEEELRSKSLCQIKTDLSPVKMYHQLMIRRGKIMTRQMQIFKELLEEHFNEE